MVGSTLQGLVAVLLFARPAPAFGGLAVCLELYPGRRVIARPFPAPHASIHVGTDQALCDGWAGKQVIDAKTGVSRISVTEVVPEREDLLTRMQRAKCVGPALLRQRVKRSADFGAEKRIVEPALTL
jgi:hypothetical protein